MSHWKLEIVVRAPCCWSCIIGDQALIGEQKNLYLFFIFSLRPLYPERNPVTSCLHESWYGEGWVRIYGSGMREIGWGSYHLFCLIFTDFFSECCQSPPSALPPISDIMRKASFLFLREAT